MPDESSPTEPQTKSPDSTMTWREKLQERWSESLGKMHLLGKMLGAESLRRGMRREEDLAHADALAYHNLLHGDRGKDAMTNASDDDMGHMVLGDMVEHHVHQQPKSSGIGKLLLGAGLLATGVGAGVGVPLIVDALKNNQQPTVVAPVKPEPETIIKRDTWTVGEPIVE